MIICPKCYNKGKVYKQVYTGAWSISPCTCPISIQMQDEIEQKHERIRKELEEKRKTAIKAIQGLR